MLTYTEMYIVFVFGETINQRVYENKLRRNEPKEQSKVTLS